MTALVVRTTALLWAVLAVTVVLAETSEKTMSRKAQVQPWPPATAVNPSIQDLSREYYSIFQHGNRNAASHRWSTFLLDRADQMTVERLEFFFTGFCAVSGSPVRPSDYNRYRLTLPRVGTGDYATGFMHYCCWPCVCDTQDFIRVDTRNITSSDGISIQRHFAVIGNPCDHPEMLGVPFVQPFGRGTTTLLETAREVRCEDDGVLEGATLSDHGFIIIGMFFDAVPTSEQMLSTIDTPEPGRITTINVDGKQMLFHDEREWEYHCKDRAANGYNSGMGEIFRKVCSISPISEEALVGPSKVDKMELLHASDSDEEQAPASIPSFTEPEPSCDVSRAESMVTES